MNRIILFFLLLASQAFVAVTTAYAQQDEPHDFKGIKLGSSPKDLPEDKYSCAFENERGDTTCRLKGWESIAGHYFQMMELTYYDRKLSAITIFFKESEFLNVVAALTERYGEPKTESRPMQNRMGATFDSRIHHWLGKVSQIEAHRFVGRIDNSMVLIAMRDHIAKWSERNKKQRSEAAKDL